MGVKRAKRRPNWPAPQRDDDRRQLGQAQPTIAHRAYKLFEQRDHMHGQDLEDWLEAERQILSEARR
jgi:hypothetical protein